MNRIITFTLTIICLTFAININAANKKANIYAFGFSASFTDSIVYFTDIQQIHNVMFERKTHFLENREAYSHQLKDYFLKQGQPSRIIVFYYNTKQKNIEKKFRNLKRKYSKDGKYDIKHLSINDFKFELVDYDDNTPKAEAKQKTPKKSKRKVKEAKSNTK